MNMICPACNGLLPLEDLCPDCGGLMEDDGPVTTFYDPYSPYEDENTLEAGGIRTSHAGGWCTHLLYCPACGRDKSVPVQLVAG